MAAKPPKRKTRDKRRRGLAILGKGTTSAEGSGLVVVTARTWNILQEQLR
jgi:hypothetical protein